LKEAKARRVFGCKSEGENNNKKEKTTNCMVDTLGIQTKQVELERLLQLIWFPLLSSISRRDF